MKTLIFLTLSLLLSTSNGCLKLDLILIGDFSASVEGNQVFISSAFMSLVQKFELSEEGVKVGCLIFNDHTTVVSPLSSNKGEVLSRLFSLRSTPCSSTTNAISPLQESLSLLTQDVSRTDATKIIILVSDGDVDDPDHTLIVASQLRMLGIGICTVLIKDPSAKPEFMNSLSTDCYVETNYEELGESLKKLDFCL